MPPTTTVPSIATAQPTVAPTASATAAVTTTRAPAATATVAPLPAAAPSATVVPGHLVAIVRGSNPIEMVRQAVNAAGGLSQVVKPGSRVILKPNLTIPSASGKGNVTDVRVLEAVVRLCREAGAGEIVVCDGAGGGDTEEIMRLAGYEPVLKAHQARFVDLNNDAAVEMKLPTGFAMKSYQVSQTVATAPVVISLPVLKTHNGGIVTIACKNMFGVTSVSAYGKPRAKLHELDLPSAIADVARLHLPDFAIVDAIVALEGDSPLNGNPVPMNLVLAGRNPVAVDAVGAAVMGFEPKEVRHLELLNQAGAGPIDLAQIGVVGSSIADVRRPFKRA